MFFVCTLVFITSVRLMCFCWLSTLNAMSKIPLYFFGVKLGWWGLITSDISQAIERLTINEPIFLPFANRSR